MTFRREDERFAWCGAIMTLMCIMMVFLGECHLQKRDVERRAVEEGCAVEDPNSSGIIFYSEVQEITGGKNQGTNSERVEIRKTYEKKKSGSNYCRHENRYY